MKQDTILFVEDDEHILGAISESLANDHYRVLAASSGERALELLKEELPDVILLDLNLPGMSGIELARQIKKSSKHHHIPIIILTGVSFEDILVEALEDFADDYIIKPVRPRVIKARLAAVLRRTTKDKVEDVLRVNTQTYDVTLNGVSLNLTKSEFCILRFLYQFPNRPFSREEIIKQIRGEDYHVVSRSLDYQIFGIRKKLGEYAYLIETVRGVGFRYRLGE